jgi:hypothetical protein
MPENTDQQGDQGDGGRGRRASAAAEGVGAAPRVAVLSVGYFTHRDPILGGERDRVGVVLAVGDRLQVAPIEHYRIEIDPAEFEPITPDDLS